MTTPDYEDIGILGDGGSEDRIRAMGLLSRMTLPLREVTARAYLKGVHLTEVMFGDESVIITNKLNISATQTATATGDIGRDAGGNLVVFGVVAAAVQKILDHGESEGLSDDDHTQYILVDGTRAFTGAQSMGSNKITSLADGTASSDGVNKGQLDAVSAGLDPKASVRLATAAALPANTASGTGVGKTLTMNAAAVLAVDGVNTVLDDRILVKDESTGANNGVYKVTTEGTALVAAVLTRATDFDEDAEVTAGAYMPVEEGTDNGDFLFLLTTNNVITVDTTALVFARFGISDHGGLAGLGDDDHTIYALLAGRSGGQTLIGGTGASEDLTLESTANATKGNIAIVAGTDMKFAGTGDSDADLSGGAADSLTIGTAFKLKSVTASTITGGDYRFIAPDGSAAWRLIERPDGITMLNEMTGTEFDMVLRRRGGLLRRAAAAIF